MTDSAPPCRPRAAAAAEEPSPRRRRSRRARARAGASAASAWARTSSARSGWRAPATIRRAGEVHQRPVHAHHRVGRDPRLRCRRPVSSASVASREAVEDLLLARQQRRARDDHPRERRQPLARLGVVVAEHPARRAHEAPEGRQHRLARRRARGSSVSSSSSKDSSRQ